MSAATAQSALAAKTSHALQHPKWGSLSPSTNPYSPTSSPAEFPPTTTGWVESRVRATAEEGWPMRSSTSPRSTSSTCRASWPLQGGGARVRDVRACLASAPAFSQQHPQGLRFYAVVPRKAARVVWLDRSVKNTQCCEACAPIGYDRHLCQGYVFWFNIKVLALL